MSRRLISKLSYSNVVSTLCLFLLLGGAAYAAGSINGKSIKKTSIPGNRLKKNSVTGTQVKESSLAAVPRATTATNANHATNADQLGGLGSTAFVQGGGQVFRAIQITIPASSSGTVLAVPGIATLELTCDSGGNGVFTLTNHSGATMHVAADALAGGGSAASIADGANTGALTTNTSGNVATFQASTLSGTPKLVTFIASNGFLSGNCVVAAQALT